MVAAVKVPLYERKGDKDGYWGYPYKHWLRYQFHYSDYVKMGFVASQDGGEPFFGGKTTWVMIFIPIICRYGNGAS